MTFEERKQVAKDRLVEFLGDFSPPRGLDTDKLSNRIRHIADAMARRLPAGQDYEEKMDQVFMRIRDTHMSNTWPSQAEFIVAMPGGDFKGVAPASYKSDDPERMAKLMREGASIPEREAWKNHTVEQDVIDRYRSASVDNWRSVHGPDALGMMQRKYGPIVSQYFTENHGDF